MAQQYPDYLKDAGLGRVRPPQGVSQIGGRNMTLHPRQFAQMVRNVSTLVEGASRKEMAEAHAWYPQAHDLANQIAHGHTERGATAIAALSPQQEWGSNQQMARELPDLAGKDVAALRMGDRSPLAGKALNRQSSDFILRAHGLLHGEIDPHTVLDGDLKVNNFARNINDPSEPKSVTIDTHAHDAAAGWKAPYKHPRGLQSLGRYDTFSKAYDMASQRTGIDTNNVTQAAAWVRWRNLPHPRGGSAAAL